MSFFKQSISEKVWYDNYKWESDNDFSDTMRRVAKAVASAEKDQTTYEEEFYSMLINKLYVPGGRVLSNAGTGLKETSLINCFVSGFRGKHIDSIKSIYEELARQAQILKSEGGYGFCINPLRPRGAFIRGVGIESPGAVEFLKLWDTSSAVITGGSKTNKKSSKGKNKARKGAMMVTMSIDHASIEEFITAKRTPGNLEKFNMSVLITDEFMDAVDNHKSWDIIFPETSFERYNDEWDGNLRRWKAKGYPFNIYKHYEDANELWDMILHSAYHHNEPGVIFIDRVNALNNLYYCEEINSPNPCGEQYLPVGGSCNLGHINLTQFIDIDNKCFDIDKLNRFIPLIVRFQDNINDISNFPLEEQKNEALNKRRVGIGFMGYGSSLYLLRIPYGSKEALEITEKLCGFVTDSIYNSSVDLAIEKGVFPDLNIIRYTNSVFIKNALSKETIDRIKRYGIRNSHLTTIAPTGNTGVFTDNVSGGIEPVIDYKYIRTVVCAELPDGLTVPQNINWAEKKYDNGTGWDFITEGKDTLLKKIHNETVYKIDRSRGLTREEVVYDYSVPVNPDRFSQDLAAGADYIKTISNLKPEEHINTMKVFAKYIDSSISKTINLPADYPYESFVSIYMDAYKSGTIKGITTYRAGTMASVVKSIGSSDDESAKHKRPERLSADVHRIKVTGDDWVVFVGLYKGKPYEVFAGKIDLVGLPCSIKKVDIIKNKKTYGIEYEGEMIIKDINAVFKNDVHEALTRLISTALRNSVSLTFIIDQLSKAKGPIVNFEKSIIVALKQYIADGEQSGNNCPECEQQLIYHEGCVVCKNCGFSKCI